VEMRSFQELQIGKINDIIQVNEIIIANNNNLFLGGSYSIKPNHQINSIENTLFNVDDKLNIDFNKYITTNNNSIFESKTPTEKNISKNIQSISNPILNNYLPNSNIQYNLKN
jgi:hypothetical protein